MEQCCWICYADSIAHLCIVGVQKVGGAGILDTQVDGDV